jgi:hypothetical protein
MKRTLVLLALLLSGCATEQPVLLPGQNTDELASVIAKEGRGGRALPVLRRRLSQAGSFPRMRPRHQCCRPDPASAVLSWGANRASTQPASVLR